MSNWFLYHMRPVNPKLRPVVADFELPESIWMQLHLLPEDRPKPVIAITEGERVVRVEQAWPVS